MHKPAVKAFYVISLDTDVARREAFFAQPESRPFQVIPGIDLRDEATDLDPVFDSDGFVVRYGRPPARAEIGCTLSHLEAIRRVATNSELADSDYGLICEDDARFTENYAGDVPRLTRGQFDILVLCFVRAARNWESRIPISAAVRLPSGSEAGPVWPNAGIGAAGYLVSKRAARGLLAEIGRDRPSWLADDFVFFRDQGVRVWAARPLLIDDDPLAASSIQDERGPLTHDFEAADRQLQLRRHVEFWHDRRMRKRLWFVTEHLRGRLGWRLRTSGAVKRAAREMDDLANALSPLEAFLRRTATSDARS